MAYKNKQFQIKNDSLIDQDIEFASRHCTRLNKVFLADGDALIIPQQRLVSIFKRIRKGLPHINRISLYANAKSIRTKSVEQLQELRKLGLHRIYMGLESGNDTVLRRIGKGETSQTMIEAAKKVKISKVFLSLTVLLGIGGTDLSEKHAIATAETINEMQPNQVAALTLMVLDSSPLHTDLINGAFTLPDKSELLKELRIIVSNLSLNRCQFHSNHGSNYLPLEGRLPKDKDTLLHSIDMALSGQSQLVPEYLRAL